ncbi:MAG: orotidine-5'-phosphate decarboxylase [Candidatus Omnitrophota bacterium]
MCNIKDKLIVALDVDTLDKARSFVDKLYPAVKAFKIGSQLFTACGPQAVKMVTEKGGSVFLDLKFHDIPNTVRSAVLSGVNLNGVFMMTVHIAGGAEMLKKAVEGATEKAGELKIKRPLIVGITVLTSDKSSTGTVGTVLERAELALESGLDGVVCSVHEASAVREICGKDFIIVTPGIRPVGAEAGDQERVSTAQSAIDAGANYIVVGRPILEAPDPLAAVKKLLG